VVGEVYDALKGLEKVRFTVNVEMGMLIIIVPAMVVCQCVAKTITRKFSLIWRMP